MDPVTAWNTMHDPDADHAERADAADALAAWLAAGGYVPSPARTMRGTAAQDRASTIARCREIAAEQRRRADVAERAALAGRVFDTCAPAHMIGATAEHYLRTMAEEYEQQARDAEYAQRLARTSGDAEYALRTHTLALAIARRDAYADAVRVLMIAADQ